MLWGELALCVHTAATLLRPAVLFVLQCQECEQRHNASCADHCYQMSHLFLPGNPHSGTHTQFIMVQVLPLLVDSESVTGVLQPLLSVFALRDSNGDGDGQCLIDGLDAMGKLLVPLAGPVLMVLAPCVFLVMYRLSVSQTIDQGEST